MMGKKSILFVVKYFPTVSETFIVNQINGLLDEGYQVSLCAYHKASIHVIHDSLTKYHLNQKVQYFVKAPSHKLLRLVVFFKWTFKNLTKINWYLFFKTLNVFKNGKDAYTLKLFFEAQWFLFTNDYDVIHAHFGMNGNRIAYLKAKGILSKDMPLLTTFHGYDLAPDKIEHYKKDYAYLLKEAQAFTVNTPYLEGLLKSIYENGKPCFILPVGLDTEYFQRQLPKTNQKTFDLVFCGRLIDLKGADIAITIVNQLQLKGYTQVRLKIIGEGKMRLELEKEVQRLGLSHSVIFYGSQSQDALRNHFEQSDAFLLPGRYDTITGRAETQGLVIQEAQAMELPVVVSDVGGMKYGLLDGKTGYVIEGGTVDGFVEVFETLNNDKDLRLRMGQAGRDFVVKHYDNKILVKKLIHIYEHIT